MKVCIIHYDLPKTNWYADILKNFTYGSLSKFGISYDLIFNGDKFPDLKKKKEKEDKDGYDIIDMSEWCNPWHQKICREYSNPVVCTTAEVSINSLRGYLERNNIDDQFMLSKIRHFIARSSWTRDMLIQFGIPGDKIDIIHYGADLNKFDYKGKGSDLKSFLYVGSINRQKGIHHLIDAYLKIMDKTDWKLKICVGEWNNDQDLLRYIESLAMTIADKIQLIPFHNIDEIAEIYHSESGCFCHIQDYDCPAQCSNPSIWALGCGLPLISLDIGVFRDYIRDGENGYLCKNVDELSEKMFEMTQKNWKDLRNMRKISRTIAERDHSSESIAAKYRNVYNKVLEIY